MMDWEYGAFYGFKFYEKTLKLVKSWIIEEKSGAYTLSQRFRRLCYKIVCLK